MAQSTESALTGGRVRGAIYRVCAHWREGSEVAGIDPTSLSRPTPSSPLRYAPLTQKAQSTVASLLVRAVLFCTAAVLFYRYFIVNRPLILVQFASFLSTTPFCTRIRLLDHFHHAFSFRVAFSCNTRVRRARGGGGHVRRSASRRSTCVAVCSTAARACVLIAVRCSVPGSGTAACKARPG